MRKYISGLIAGVVISLFFVGITMWKDFSRITGGGITLASPNGQLIAYAGNIYPDEKSGAPAYYVFSVSTADRVLIVSRKMVCGDDWVSFRGNEPGDHIQWSADSEEVVFMHDGQELWREHISNQLSTLADRQEKKEE